MKLRTSRFPQLLAGAAAVIIVMMPFHAFLTVWLSSFTGYYAALRSWKEILLIALVIGTSILLVRRKELRAGLARDRLIQLIALYGVLLVIAGVIALIFGAVTPRAMVQGLVLDGRFLAFFVVVYVLSCHRDLIQAHWRRLLLIPAALVIGIALLQYFVLPPLVLEQFGYGSQTIDPLQTIDNKDEYQRVQSTLRGANPLGAYLVIILAATAALTLRGEKFDVKSGVYFVLAGLVLVLTFSRSAWIGAVLALGWMLWLVVARSRQLRRLALVAAAVLLLAGLGAGYALRDNDHFQNAFFHTDENTTSATSSNDGHWNATYNGVRDVVFEPLGRGTGTAGPASLYNEAQPGRIAENYYVQIGQEAGVIGIALFAGINVLVGIRLWRRRDTMLPRVLLASLIGITAINMLMHAWTDDTLAYVWWGLAAAALASAGDSKSEEL